MTHQLCGGSRPTRVGISGRVLVAFSIVALHGSSVLPAQVPEGLGRGWTGEFEHAARQLIALAEATPEEKFSFRPAPGVRSTSELYMHVAVGNYWLLAQAGVKPGGTHWPNEIAADIEKKVSAKADVVRWLRDSIAAVRAVHGKLDESRMVTFLGAEVAASQVLLRLLVHNHEHMGQAIAYARMSGVTPPWSNGAKGDNKRE